MSKGENVKVSRPGTTPKAAIMKAQELSEEKAKIAQILSSGLTADMLKVPSPDPDKRYAYVRERDVDIAKYRSLGYELVTDQPAGEHDAGDSRRRVGDVVLMSIDRGRHALIEEVREEQVERRKNVGIEEYKRRAAKAAAMGDAAPPIDLMEES